MLSAIVRWSLSHRLIVILLWLGIAAVGVLALLRLPIDAFPDTTPIQVQVNTVAPALSPLEIERQITTPVEQVLSGLPGLEEVRSLSKFGLSQVTVIFAEGTDVYLARQLVSERVQAVSLAEGIQRPTLGPVATGLGEIFHYVLTGASLAELRSLNEWLLKPQLSAVPGVAEVNTWGGDERQIQIIVDPLKLQQHGLTLSALASAIEENNANVGAGAIERAGETTLVQGVGLVKSPQDLAEMVIDSRGGVPLRVKDVARVSEGRELRRGAATADGRGEVVLGLGFLLIGENSHRVTQALSLRLAEIQKSLPPGVTATPVYERTTLVEQVLSTVKKNLLEGALLVIAVLFLFLGSLRAGLLVAAAIPLSMLFAFDLMLRFGIAGSLMSLGAIDFGLIVDSSVIQIENAVRHLALDKRRSKLELIRDAVLEVRKPTMFGELIILIVYVPILALEGIEGKLFRPMALTAIFALLGSMVLSLTLMPVLASLFLPRHPTEREGLLTRAAKALYRPVLAFVLRQRWVVLSAAALLTINVAFLASRLGTEFVPKLKEGSIVINTIRLAGVSADESVRYGTQIERLLLASFPDEIDRIWTRTGTAEVATDPMGLELSDVFITLTPSSEWTRASTQDELTAEMEGALEGLPGMRTVFTQPIEMRVSEMLAGIRADVGIKLFGDDLILLKAKAKEIEGIIKELPGATDVLTEQTTGQPLLQIELDRTALGRYGVTAKEVLEVLEALGSREVGQLQEGERRFPIVLRLDDKYRTSPAAVGRILVTTAKGDRIPLARLVKATLIETPSTINREWGKRRVVVQANVRGRDVGSFVAEARERLEALALPSGYYLRFGGQFEHLAAAQLRLLIVVPVALLLIFVLLYFTYGRVLDAARIFTGVPFAVVGGVVALWLRGIPFSISAGVGFVALSGVAVLGDMVLVSTIKQLRSRGIALTEAIEQAALQRLRPVLMTALVVGVGFVPVAFNTGLGAEVQRPLATVVIGGVLSSTILTLLVLPVLYSLFGAGEPDTSTSE